MAAGPNAQKLGGNFCYMTIWEGEGRGGQQRGKNERRDFWCQVKLIGRTVSGERRGGDPPRSGQLAGPRQSWIERGSRVMVFVDGPRSDRSP